MSRAVEGLSATVDGPGERPGLSDLAPDGGSTELTEHEAEDLATRIPPFAEAVELPYDASPFRHVTVSVGIAHTEQGPDVTASANIAWAT